MKASIRFRFGNWLGYAILMAGWIAILLGIAINSPDKEAWERVQMFVSGTIVGAGVLYIAQQLGILVFKYRADHQITIDTEEKERKYRERSRDDNLFE